MGVLLAGFMLGSYFRVGGLGFGRSSRRLDAGFVVGVSMRFRVLRVFWRVNGLQANPKP